MSLKPKRFMSDEGKIDNRKSSLITIKASGFNVEGDMKNNFSFQLQAKWADLFSGLIPGAELLQKTGDASLTTGIFSRKYFQGGNALSLSPEFRIYDDGSTKTNPVIKAAKDLASMTVSDAFNGKGSGTHALTKFGNALESSKNVVTDVFKGKFNTNEIEAILKDFSSSNRTVEVSIGNIFSCKSMIIESVNVSYSREMTDTGPLYGDFQVSVMSLEALVRGDGTYGVNNLLGGSLAFQVTIDGE